MTTRPAKEEYRPLCLALQADVKGYGIAKLARQWGVNPETLANQFNPNNSAHLPNGGKLLEAINLTQAERAVFEICQLVGKVPVDMEVVERSPTESLKLLMNLMHKIGGFVEKGGEAASDLILDADEKRMLEPLAREVAHVALGFAASLRG